MARLVSLVNWQILKGSQDLFILSAWLCLINKMSKMASPLCSNFSHFFFDGLGGVQSHSKHIGLKFLLKDYYIFLYLCNFTIYRLHFHTTAAWMLLKTIVKKQVYENKNVLSERILKSEGAYRPTYLSWIYVIKRRRRDQHSGKFWKLYPIIPEYFFF